MTKTESKICPVCKIRFKKNCSRKKWAKIINCSLKCKKLYLLTDEYKQERLKYLLSRTIITESGCMEWQGSRHNIQKYGYTSFQGKLQRAHRIVWKIVNGEIPENIDILHTCDNPPCINPKHLFLGTHQDNMDDKVKKGRQSLKLTPHKLKQLLKMANKGIKYNSISNKLGISRQRLNKIACENGIRRKNVGIKRSTTSQIPS